MKKLEEVAEDTSQTLKCVLPEGYVLVFVLLPQKLEKGTEYIIGSVPALVGGEESVRTLLQRVFEGTDEEASREVEVRPSDKY